MSGIESMAFLAGMVLQAGSPDERASGRIHFCTAKPVKTPQEGADYQHATLRAIHDVIGPASVATPTQP